MIFRSIGELIEGRPLHAVGSHETILEVCRRLDGHHVGALAVLDGDELVGIISERDVVSRVVARGRSPAETPVRSAMTPDPKTVAIGDGLADALQAMLDGHFRHLPVMRDGRAVGMISMRDIPTEYRLMYQRFREARQAQEAVEA
jgi:CBS domain-containing protein